MRSGDNPPPFDVAFVAKDSQANIAPQQLVSDLNNKFGANITNVLFDGWSAGVGGAFNNVCKFVKNLLQKNLDANINMVAVDALISGGTNAAVGAGITPKSDRDKLNGKYAKYVELLKNANVHFYTIGEYDISRGKDGNTLAAILNEFGLDSTEIAVEDIQDGNGVGHSELFRLSLEI